MKYTGDNLCNSLFWPVQCNHTQVLGPCSVPGLGTNPDEIKTCGMVWNFLAGAFSVKASLEALQKTIRKIKVPFGGTSDGCRLTCSYVHKKT